MDECKPLDGGRAGLMQKIKTADTMKWAQFWGSHQRFFRQMLLSAKVPALAKLTLEAGAYTRSR